MAKKIAADKVAVVKLEYFGDDMWLTAPFSSEMNERYKELKGRWQPTSKTWRFVKNAIITATLRDLCVDKWGVSPALEELVLPYPEDKPKPGDRWKRKDTREMPVREDKPEPHIFVSDKQSAIALVDALIAYLPVLTIEEKEEVLKPLFDAL